MCIGFEALDPAKVAEDMAALHDQVQRLIVERDGLLAKLKGTETTIGRLSGALRFYAGYAGANWEAERGARARGALGEPTP